MTNRPLNAARRNLLTLLAKETPRSKLAAARHLAEIDAAEKRVAALMPKKYSRAPERGWWRW